MLFGCCQLMYQFMFGSQHHKGYPINGVHAGGEDFDIVVRSIRYWKLHACAYAFTDPVALLFFQRFGPVYGVQAGQQAISIGRNPHHPLTHQFLLDRIAAPFRNPIFHLVVGQHGS